ncbi:MAG: poly-gamma-glutamate system protein [Microvirga sp.]
MSASATLAPPRAPSRWPASALAASAIVVALAWWAVEHLGGGGLHPRSVEMLTAARALQSASRVIAAEKAARGLMQPAATDPNRTGLIGPEFTAITTTMGDLASKRTVTNPDFAAALVRSIAGLNLPAGSPVVVIVSGSFVGADIASLAAVEALGLRPVLIASLSASMFGATDPDFNILDMLGVLRRQGVLRTTTAMAVLGGEKGIGGDMEKDAADQLRASASREEVRLVDAPPYPAIIDRLLEEVDRLLGAGTRAGLVINVGGALVALGTCPESYGLQPGMTLHPADCREGTPGLPLRLAVRDDALVLHIINIRKLALDLGLPFDPKPLPQPGSARSVYTASSTSTNTILQGATR